jgi:glutathione S-transferase
MVLLLDQDIQTREILNWKGVHLFHFHSSSCSQKTRIFLNLKGLTWTPHQIDLSKKEQFESWYLGINPRGLVPSLVFNGNVHIESNDIIQLLDQQFPQNPLIPAGFKTHMSEMLHHEDELHLDLRTLTFRFTQPRGKAPRSQEDLKNYRERGSGTVQGQADLDKEREIVFWETAANDGITNRAVQISVAKFQTALDDLNQILSNSPYLLGNSLSVLDIAWFVYVNRLILCGYPLEKLHPLVNNWFTSLNKKSAFAKEIIVPTVIQRSIEEHHQLQRETGTTMVDIANL